VRDAEKSIANHIVTNVFGRNKWRQIVTCGWRDAGYLAAIVQVRCATLKALVRFRSNSHCLDRSGRSCKSHNLAFWGLIAMSRVLIVFACSSLLTACAGEQASVVSLVPVASNFKAGQPQWSGQPSKLGAGFGSAPQAGTLQTGSLQAGTLQAGTLQGVVQSKVTAPKIVGFYQPPKVALTEEEQELRQAAKKTMAGRVLGAIALEQVTGRKPDPARLSQ
jgi:hypothetical protein